MFCSLNPTILPSLPENQITMTFSRSSVTHIGFEAILGNQKEEVRTQAILLGFGDNHSTLNLSV